MRKQIGIVSISEKIPGGLPLMSMLTVMLVNTFFPQLLNIGYYTTALFSAEGTKTFIGLILFISGTQVDVSSFLTAWLRGGVYMILRLVTGLCVSASLHSICGLDGFWGIPTLSFVICLCSLNPGVYMTGMQKYGDDLDRAVFGPLNLWAVPTMPLLILSLSSGVQIDSKLVISTLLPFLLGFVLGNIDDRFKALFSSTTKVVLIFLFATFGANINLFDVLKAGVSGIILTVIFTVVSLILTFAVDRFILRGKGYAGVAACSVCGAFVPSAALVAAALPQYEPYAAIATAQVSMAYVITGFSCLFITDKIARKVGCPAFEKQSSD